MRSAVLQLPATRTPGQMRQVMRSAMRQLERADLYLAAAAHMELDDLEAERAISRLRAELEALRRYLAVRRRALRG